MPFHFKSLAIPEIIHIEPEVHGDERGFFAEIYRYPEFKNNGIGETFAQVSYSKSSKGIVRGLHYQKSPMAQGKLVSVMEGEIFDVAVDIRAGSPTYGRWVSATLNAEKKNMLYIPEGFAHGFCVLSQTVQMVYYCTQVYSLEHERGIRWDDPGLNIAWPVKEPVLSKRDSAMPLLRDADNNFEYGKG